MHKKVDEKPLKAEVIDMDRVQSRRSRPSEIFSERLEPSLSFPPDDPASRFLFDDIQESHRRKKRIKPLRVVRNLGLSLAVGMAGAWLVLTLPGFGPREHQEMMVEQWQLTQARLGELEMRLVQSQARVVELARNLEIQRDLLEQGETARRSMLVELRSVGEKTDRSLEQSRADRQRIGNLELSNASLAAGARRQSEKLGLVEAKFASELELAQKLNEKRVDGVRNESIRQNRENYLQLSRYFESEWAAIRQSEIHDVRGRVERLAEHVWQEVGRLDGRIVRASTETPSPR